jgi:alpha-amylase
LSNKDVNQKSMEIGKRYAGKRFMISRDILQDKITIDENGWADFLCPAGNVSVWVEE